jgi:hypothetical protein
MHDLIKSHLWPLIKADGRLVHRTSYGAQYHARVSKVFQRFNFIFDFIGHLQVFSLITLLLWRLQMLHDKILAPMAAWTWDGLGCVSGLKGRADCRCSWRKEPVAATPSRSRRNDTPNVKAAVYESQEMQKGDRGECYHEQCREPDDR